MSEGWPSHLDRYHRIYDWLSHYTLGSDPTLPERPNSRAQA